MVILVWLLSCELAITSVCNFQPLKAVETKSTVKKTSSEFDKHTDWYH